MGKSANRSKHGYLQVSKEKIKQPTKQLRLTQMSQQTDALFESDDSFEEVAAASLPVAATTCPVSGPASNTRPNPTKRRNESDSEVEINNSIKQSLLKNEQRWIFVDSHKIIVITPTSDYWPEGVDFIQRSTLEENKRIDLIEGTEPVSCRLLFKGQKKYVNSVYAKYQEQLRNGKKPESLNATYIKTDRKRKVCDDINFLSRSSKTSFTTLKNFGGSPIEVTTVSTMQPSVTQQQVNNQGPQAVSTEQPENLDNSPITQKVNFQLRLLSLFVSLFLSLVSNSIRDVFVEPRTRACSIASLSALNASLFQWGF